MKHLILILALFSIGTFADDRFNPVSGRWESVDGDEDTLKYDPVDGEWSYEEEDSTYRYDNLDESDDDDSGWDYEEDD